MFTLKLVARPDARMVEVPLEIEAELPREFDGAALLASSGLPRRVRLKATKDALKLSTAYRADQLVGDIVKSALRGSAEDVTRAQDAVMRFVRAVRERRQDGATLVISSNGRGKIDIVDQTAPRTTPPAVAHPGQTTRIVLPADRSTVLERRVAELEAVLSERVLALEQKLASAMAQLSRMQYVSEVAGPGMERGGARARTGAGTRRATAVEAYAEGLRAELTARAAAASARARTDVERCDRASALIADAEMLGAPSDGTSQRLRDASAQAAARQTALERLAEEIEFYAGADLPVAAQLLGRLEDTSVPDPAPSLEPIAEALIRGATGPDEQRSNWVLRAATLAAWQLVSPNAGDPLDPASHQAIDSGGSAVAKVACPGVKRADGSLIAHARVLAAGATPETGSTTAAPAAPEGAAPAAGDAAAAAAAAEPSAAAADAAAPAAPPEVRAFPAPGVETPILPEEAAAAAAAAARVPRLIVADDPAASDELAVEVALSALRPVTHEPVQAGDANVEEVHPLVDPLPDDAEPNE